MKTKYKIRSNYEGNPFKAFSILKNTMDEAKATPYLNKNDTLKINSNLYRIRLNRDNYAFQREEMFHIPFESRSKVSTQRYSIPGLPSLYLANSIYLAWEELKRPNFNEIQVARFNNTGGLNLLDLSTESYTANDSEFIPKDHIYDYLYKVMTWPLIAACSVKVQNPSDTFKPEYIIPQLLLQFVKDDESFYGIKYSSTHLDLNKSKSKGNFYNYVFPVKTFDLEKGHCPKLILYFKTSNTLPLQLRQFITQTDRFNDQDSINSNVSSIELIENRIQPYHETIFGVMEHNLNGMEVKLLPSKS